MEDIRKESCDCACHESDIPLGHKKRCCNQMFGFRFNEKEGIKLCRSCNEIKPVSDFSINKDRFGYRCKTCDREVAKKRYVKNRTSILARDRLRYQEDESKRNKNIEKGRKYYADNSAKIKARSLLSYAVKMGRIIKPEKCEACNQVVKVEGHHENGYENPYDVKWICRKCHEDTHHLCRRIEKILDARLIKNNK